MENKIIFGIIFLIGAYFLLRQFNKRRGYTDPYSEILTKEEYKVKGQWDR